MGAGQGRPTEMANTAAQRAFSLVEMVMVVLTIGIIAMIAVPRMSQAAGDAKASAILANIRVLQNALDMYEAEHGNRSPAHNPDGTVSTDGDRFAKRLTGTTSEDGRIGGLFGPYLLRIPPNPGNGLATVRIDGPPAGAATAGWRYDTTARSILPDHLSEATTQALIKVRGRVKGSGDGALEAQLLK